MQRALRLFTVAVLCLLAASTAMAAEGEGIVVVEDDFELYISQAAFGGAYQVTDGRTIARLSTDANHTEGGMQSVMLKGQMGAVIGLPSGLESTTTQVAIKSNGPGTQERGLLRLRWSGAPGGARDILVGLWPGRDTFMYRDTLAGIGWTEAEVARTAGWHEITVRTGPDGLAILIDATHVYANPDFKGVSSVGFVDLWSAPDDQMLPVYFDDLVVSATSN